MQPIVWICAALVCTWAMALPAKASDDSGAPVRIALKAADLPLSAYKDMNAANHIYSRGKGRPPEGFHSLVEGELGAVWTAQGRRGGTPVRFVVSGESAGEVRLFHWPEGGEPVEIQRAKKSPFKQNLSFGPFRHEGHPPVQLLLMFPAKYDFPRWKARRKFIRAFLPRGICLGPGHPATL